MRHIGTQGLLTLAGGELAVASATRLPGSQFNWTAGTLRLTAPDSTLGAGLLDQALTLSRGMTLATNAFSVGAFNQLTLAGGTLTGSGALVNDGSVIGFGTIAGTGGFVNLGLLTQSGGGLLLSNAGENRNDGNWDLAAGKALQLSGATLINNGALNLNAGQVTGSGTLINAAGGVIFGRGAISTNFANDGALQAGIGSVTIASAFSNTGVITLTSSAALLGGGLISNSGRIEGLGRVSNAVSNSGTIEASGGTLTLAGAVTNSGVIAAGAGNRVLVSGGLTANAGQIQLAGGTFDNNGNAITNNSGATISGYGTVRSGALGNNGQMLMAAGNSAVYSNLASNSNSQIVLSGNSNTTFYGTVEIKGGAELRVSQGSVATFFGQVNQRTGAQFTGTGTKFYEGGLAVGNSPGLGTDAGSVTFGANNTYSAEIGGTNPGDAFGNGIQFDRYVVGGILTFGGTLKVVQYGGFNPQAGQSFDLFDWGARQGQFASLDFTGLALSNGLAWDTSRLYTDGTLTVAAVPEPGSYAMFAAGLGLMGLMVRRRRTAKAA